MSDAKLAPETLTRKGRTVRSHIAVMTIALVTPILLFVGFLLWQFASGERKRLESDAFETARSIGSALDRDLAGILAALDVLSMSAYLQAGDIEGFHRQALELSERQGIVAVLSDARGQQLVNVRVPRGTTLPRTNLPEDAREAALARPFVTNIYRGAVSNQPIFAAVTAIRRGGEVAYVLLFSLDTERLQRIIREAEVPEGYTVAIVDRAGIIMARNTRPEEFVGSLATQDLRDASLGRSGSWSGFTADGQAVFGAFTRSRVADFRIAVGVRYSQLNAPIWHSLSLFAAIGIVTLALSVVLGLVFGQQITAPIRALAARATELGRGEPVLALATGLREANQVSAELAAASEARRSREAELRDANEEIQRFAYIVSHDLRSPLVNIMGFTTELEELRTATFDRLESLRQSEQGAIGERAEDRRLAEDFDEAIAFIKASISKMDRLINAILRLSREGRRDFRPERIDMDALVQSIGASLAHQADTANATIVASALPAVTSDRLALEQVFSNLMDNALKYLRSGVPGRIEIAGRAQADKVVYDIRDNGRGIDPKDRERVFELFRRSGVQDRPGEGIGLAHVRALVRRLGGTISLTSEPGRGSTFSVILPARWPGGEMQKRAA